MTIDFLFGREKSPDNMVDVSGLTKQEISIIENMIDTLRKKNK